MSDGTELPFSLLLPPHLSAQKYFFVCTLTIAAWDTLVLSPRTWRLLKTEGWPILKIFYHFLRLLLVAELAAVGVAFFSTSFTAEMCNRFYLFEPICTAILLAGCSFVHCIRISGIYGQSRPVLFALGGLTFVQVVVTAICCAFYQVVQLKPTQGCIAGPKHTWVGIYWVVPTVVYITAFILAVVRSLQSVQGTTPNYWYLMLRDNLNIYGAIAGVNLANVLFWFLAAPTGADDPIRTIVAPLALVLTVTMTLRVILGVRGPLAQGGGYTSGGGSWSSHTAAGGRGPNPLASKAERSAGAFVDVTAARKEERGAWSANAPDAKGVGLYPPSESESALAGVKVTVEHEARAL